MDHNPFAPEHHQPTPPPPPVPAFNHNFTPPPDNFTPPPAAPETPVFNQPPQAQAPLANPVAPAETLAPQPVVQVLSPRGVEYVFLTITLFTGALGLVSLLLSLVNGETGFEVLAFPLALLLVALPLFAGLFLRLKNAELRDPSLKLDASKRRSTQLIQIVSFVTTFFTLIGFVTVIFAKLSGNFDSSIIKAFLDVLVIFVVAGGILAYYWRDEHRS